MRCSHIYGNTYKSGCRIPRHNAFNVPVLSLTCWSAAREVQSSGALVVSGAAHA
jgi:hypothetical protein